VTHILSTYLFAQHGEVAFLIEDGTDGIFLYSIRNKFVGDTWHASIDEAKAQAAHELSGISGPWRIVGSEFAIQLKTGKSRL